MSSPSEVSINDGIALTLMLLSYIHIQDVIEEILALDPGTLLAKIDIKSAYYIVPVHTDDRHLLGMCFHDQVYIDAALPFGLQSAPKILMQ